MSEKEFNAVFSNRLRYFLNKYDMTQNELAKRLGVGTTSVYNWCNGIKNPRMDKVDAMCEIFNCRRSDLMEEQSAQSSYYNNPDARELARFLFENPEYKTLFEASKQVKKEDIAFITEMLNRMGGNSGSDRTTDSVAAAESAYEKALGIVPKTDSTVSNITKGTERKKQNKAG